MYHTGASFLVCEGHLCMDQIEGFSSSLIKDDLISCSSAICADIIHQNGAILRTYRKNSEYRAGNPESSH